VVFNCPDGDCFRRNRFADAAGPTGGEDFIRVKSRARREGQTLSGLSGQTGTGLPRGRARHLAVLFESRPDGGGATAADHDVVDIENLDDRARRERITASSEF
jgi:hypothetical protein